MNKELYDAFAFMAEDLGWRCDYVVYSQIDCVELEKYSPAGEDFFFDIDSECFDSYNKLYDELYQQWDDFNPDEHAAGWYGKNKGEPDSLQELLDDANAIKGILEDLLNGTRAKLKKFDNPVKQM